MDELYKIIENTDEIPYHQVLLDMDIIDVESQTEFIDTTLIFANNCFGIATSNNYPKGQRMDGQFKWSSLNPIRYFKVYFSYYHSDELIFAITGFEEQTKDNYIADFKNK